MNDGKIQLPDFLIAELYKTSLVDLNSSTTSTRLAQPESYPEESIEQIHTGAVRFLGENKRNVVIVVDEPDAVFLLEDDLSFLTNILKACHLTVADIAIINTAQQNLDYETIKQQLSTEKILFFNVEPSAIKLPFLIPAFQLQKFDGCTIMVAPPLGDLNKPTPEGKLLKTKLWISLKQIFNIP